MKARPPEWRESDRRFRVDARSARARHERRGDSDDAAGPAAHFETGLDANPANFVPLSPVSFLTRAASAFAGQGRRHRRRAPLHLCATSRSLRAPGFGSRGTRGLPPRYGSDHRLEHPELIEAFYGVPMLGAVLNPLNTRLDAANIAFSLNHGGAKVIIVDRELCSAGPAALEKVDHEIVVIDIEAPVAASPPTGALRYEEVLAGADPHFDWPGIDGRVAVALPSLPLRLAPARGGGRGRMWSFWRVAACCCVSWLEWMAKARLLSSSAVGQHPWTLPMFVAAIVCISFLYSFCCCWTAVVAAAARRWCLLPRLRQA